MRISKTSVLALIAALTALVALPAAAQTVPNGDCELGQWVAATDANVSTALQGWMFNKGSVATIGNWTIGMRAGYGMGGSGAGGFRLKPDSKYGWYRTTVAGFTVGLTYNVTAYLRHIGSGYTQLRARPKGGSTVLGPQHNTDTFTQYSVPVLPNDAGEIEIELYFATGVDASLFSDGYFDNVSIAAVPEPGGMIALLSGLIGLAGCGIRRRR